MTTVNIRWSKPSSLEDLHTNPLALQKGIYAIYRLYGGKETLIYIGKTTRSFNERLNEHYNDWLHTVRGQVFIRMGILEYPDRGRYSSQKLSDVESLLIVWHAPQQNTMSSVYYRGREELIIKNKGNRGLVAKTVSADKLVWA
ncbi:GIY-YIG nuclease family protein [Bacillus toyonensis]|uniref:GIY-YIG nuclease family protein n=1 Tax=Bacillus toyonensis TaxID=155322 RepID=UPI002E1BA581|nr:GIY-YIG nuclease family protein [Bacillus toyonensis]